MPPDEKPPCHLLRMPYEILKPILGRLNRNDQINAATAHSSLWELAYPMAHNSIVVKIGPGRRESEWSKLAAGVGIRYVQHLEIRSAYADTDRPKYVEDLVTGTLVAAMRRNQLRTFSISSSVGSNRSVSAKNVIILLETQRALKKLVLLGIDRTHDIRIRDYIEEGGILASSRHVTVTASPTLPSDQMLHDIVYSSPSPKEIHLRLPSNGKDSPYRFPAAVMRKQPGKPSLLSVATKITFKTCAFDWGGSILRSITLPALRALALVNCAWEDEFFEGLQGHQLPQLTALMVKDGDCPIFGGTIENSIQQLGPLRELVISGRGVNFTQAATIAKHGTALELLSIRRKISDAEYPPWDLDDQALGATLKSLPMIRHLHVYIKKFESATAVGKMLYPDESLRVARNLVCMHEQLHTLHLAINTVVHEKVDPQAVRRLYHSDMFAVDIASELVHSVTGRKDPLPTQYLALTNYVSFVSREVRNDVRQILSSCEQPDRYILSLKPNVVRKPAAEVKEEMMQRYEGQRYYFLEHHIDALLETGEIRVY